MNIHDSPLPLDWQIQQTQPTSEANQIDIGRIDLLEHAPAEIGQVEMLFAIDHRVGDASSVNALEMPRNSGFEPTTRLIFASSFFVAIWSMRFCSVVPPPLRRHRRV